MRRRTLLLVVLCLSVVMSSVGLGAPASAGPNDPTVLFGGRPLANNSSSVLALEKAIGRQLASVRVYYLWDSPSPTPTAPGCPTTTAPCSCR